MIRHLISCIILIAGISLAYSQDLKIEPGKSKKVTWKVGETNREAVVYAPGNASSHPPVVFCFHGHGGTAELSARRMALHDLWTDAVVVYPQGLPTAAPVIDPMGKKSGWQKYVGDQKDRDLEFFDAMLKSFIADFRIDEKRIYVTGHSNGGFFTYLLCASRPDKFAAVAPIAGAVSVRDIKNQKPVPTLHVAGKEDKIVSFASQERSMEQIRKLNGCDAEGKPSGKLCTEYPSKSGTPVVTMIHPGGHEVPTEAPEQIVAFFKKHIRK